MDVAINADAVREEDASGQPLLNLAYAFFSAAVVCSSLATGALRWALGPALFAAAMAVGPITVHRLARPGTERSVLTVGALLAGGGSALAAVAPSVSVAIVGIILAGAGCSVCAPTIVSLVGRTARPAERGTAVGSATTLMYFGFIAGPAVVDEATTLRISLGGVAVLAVLLSADVCRRPVADTRSELESDLDAFPLGSASPVRRHRHRGRCDAITCAPGARGRRSRQTFTPSPRRVAPRVVDALGRPSPGSSSARSTRAPAGGRRLPHRAGRRARGLRRGPRARSPGR